MVAAVVVAIVHATGPIAKGWWLVAYLSLVGGVAQFLLGSGLLAISAWSGGDGPSTRERLGQLALWNIGTVIVAVADVAGSPSTVLLGSAILLAALALFAAGLHRVHTTATRTPALWVRLYVVLLVFLAVSTAIGSVLAHA